MARNPLIRRNAPVLPTNTLHKSAGILDDFAVRKSVAALQGTIQKVPVDDIDIVNKLFVDGEFINLLASDNVWTGSNTFNENIILSTADIIMSTTSEIRENSSGGIEVVNPLGSSSLRLRNDTTSGVMLQLKSGAVTEVEIVPAGGFNVDFFGNNAGNNASIFLNGNITTAGASVFVEFIVDDTDDFFHINREDTNILGMKIVMPLNVPSSISLNLVSKTGAYTATTDDHTILCGSGNESFTVTLPAATGVTNIIYNIKNLGTGTITVDGNASETIDGSTTAVISTQFTSITIQCDGSNWHII